MKIINAVSVMVMLWVPSAMAGLISFDMENLTTYDWAADEAVSGGRLSFLIDETVSDMDAAPDQGRYYDAIKSGMFKNFQTGETYLFDVDFQNCVDIQVIDSFSAGINMHGYLKNEHGKSIFFELGMIANFKADDYLYTLNNNVQVVENSVLFNLFEEWDHFQGYSPDSASFNAVSYVAAPAPWFLFLMGLAGLVLRARRNLSTS